MQQKMSILTIGVNDLSAMRAFYEEKFGWKPVAVNKDIVFYQLNGSLLSFFPAAHLMQDAGIAYDDSAVRHFAMALLLQDEKEVDALYADLEQKGVEIVKKPVKTFFGAYTGYVKDVEGNLWDIGTNPLIPLDHAGNVIRHEDIRHLEQ